MIETWKKLPIKVEVLQWTGENEKEIEDFCGKDAHFDVLNTYEGAVKTLRLKTLESEKGNTHVASIGDYVIKGVKGEFYACKPDIFLETYKKVN